MKKIGVIILCLIFATSFMLAQNSAGQVQYSVEGYGDINVDYDVSYDEDTGEVDLDIDITGENVPEDVKANIHANAYGDDYNYELETDEGEYEVEVETNGNSVRVKSEFKVKEQNRFSFEGENCPEECSCSGSTIKCSTQEGREMTVTAGKSGNTIVQVKGVNMTTSVTLYQHNGTLVGQFKNNLTKYINVTPDQVQERVKEKIKAKIQNSSIEIELDEDGEYQVKAEKKARLLLMFSVKEKVSAQVDPETGEVSNIKNPWWGFLARDS